jgi:peptide/nickel transport system ATP-binding protein
MHLLEGGNLVKTFASTSGTFRRTQHVVTALDHVSIYVDKGEIVGLAGGSGHGKTTLARVLMLIYKPDMGSISLHGKEYGKKSSGRDVKAYRRHVQYILQDPYSSLDPTHSVEWHVRRPLEIIKYKGDMDFRVREILNEVSLSPPADFLNKLPHQLSGGQRQRVYIARVLSLEPEVILADEPVSNLDASVRSGILDLFKSLVKQYNTAVLYISHDLSTIYYLTGRIYVMYQGKIVESGSTDEVLTNPQAEYTRLLIAAAPDPFNRIS